MMIRADVPPQVSTVRDVGRGKVFSHEGFAWIVIDIAAPGRNETTCVLLIDGSVRYFSNETHVVVYPDAEVVLGLSQYEIEGAG